MSFVENGVLTISLFHGTSTLFLKSIERVGLGGDDPIARFQVLPVARGLFALCDQYFFGQERWMLQRLILEPCMEQAVTGGGFCWRHGQTYLSVERPTAIEYARRNRYGSELISLVAEMREDLRLVAAPELNATLIADSPIWDVIANDSEPLLVELPRVPVSILRSEDDKPLQQTLTLMETLSPVYHDSGCRLNISFRLTAPVRAEDLVLHRFTNGEKVW